jgi:hypothetical protein
MYMPHTAAFLTLGGDSGEIPLVQASYDQGVRTGNLLINSELNIRPLPRSAYFLKSEPWVVPCNV